MSASAERRPRIFVMMGTDHHRFDRLVRWTDRWASGRSDAAQVFVQFGSSRPPQHALGEGYMPHASMLAQLQEATAVVCHGGTGSAMEARRYGFVPVIVPRTRRLGEAVDDHQIEFARLMERKGDAKVAWTEEQLHTWLDQAVANPAVFRSTRNGNGVDPPVTRCAALVSRRAHRPATAPVPVLYIGGMGRSGSTLLERILGEPPEVCAVGELDNMWLRGLVENNLCGCGELFRSCPFWRDVGDRAFGGWDRLDADGSLALRQSVARHRYLPRLLVRGFSRSYEERLHRFAGMLGRLYRAIAEVSGAKVIVDSSKQPSYAYLLRLLAAVDLRVVHLIRDSRGVTHSWMKRVRRPEVVSGEEYMATFRPADMALRWNVYNALFEGFGATGVSVLRLRYEDFVRAPEAEARRLFEFAGVPQVDTSFIRDGSVELGPTHTASGNPMRFTNGTVQVRTDEAWKEQMKPRDLGVVTAVSAPWLRRYGYPLKPAR